MLHTPKRLTQSQELSFHDSTRKSLQVEKIIDSICGYDGGDDITSVDRFLGDDAIAHLCDKLRNNHLDNKRRLVLRGNCIEEAGAKALADLLAQHHNLQFVSLEWNQIGNTGAKYLATALLSNQSLLHLDLRNNGITNEGAMALASALESNSHVRVLDLRWNKIEDNGALAFKHAILDRDPKLNLMISGNLLTESTTKIIDEWNASEKKTQFELPLPPPPSNIPTSFQNELLQKEIAALRQQCMSLQSVIADTQRQLDGSALRVTDLEQQLSREEYRYNHLSESLRQANMRLSSQTEEQKILCAAWEKERTAIRDELVAGIQVKNDEVRSIALERDSYKDKLNHSEEENSRLRAQLSSLTQQYATDKAANDIELRGALNKASDLTVSETKLKAEIMSLKATNTRLTDKMAVLDNELIQKSVEHDKAIRNETERLTAELERMREDSRASLDRATERQSKQLGEIQSLQNMISHLKSQHSSQIVAMEQQYSESLSGMRSEEKMRTEQTMRDLKQRLEIVTQARAELDQRAHSLSGEMKLMRDDHHNAMEQMKTQAADMEVELQRQRSLNTNLKTVLATAETDNKSRSFELDELRKKVNVHKDQAENWNKELHSCTADKQALQSKVDKLEQQCSLHGEARSKEFSLISKGVLRAVEKELETLRVDMKIKGHH